MLEKGVRVKVYQKPVTQENFEGEAVLVERFDDVTDEFEGNKYEKWYVRFQASDWSEKFLRTVSDRDLI